MLGGPDTKQLINRMVNHSEFSPFIISLLPATGSLSISVFFFLGVLLNGNIGCLQVYGCCQGNLLGTVIAIIASITELRKSRHTHVIFLEQAETTGKTEMPSNGHCSVGFLIFS